MGILLWYDSNSPETLDALRSLGRMGMASVGVNLLDSKSQHGHGQKFEGVLKGGSVGDLGQRGVLLTGLLVCRRLQSSQRSLDWVLVSIGMLR